LVTWLMFGLPVLQAPILFFNSYSNHMNFYISTRHIGFYPTASL
jgi:hypothetical protein